MWFFILFEIAVIACVVILFRRYLPSTQPPASSSAQTLGKLRVPWHVVVTVLFGWFLSFSIVVFLPTDIGSAFHSRCLSQNQTHCEYFGSEMPSEVIHVLWNVIYWGSFFLTWAVIPLQQGYIESGGFTFLARVRSTLVSNLLFYGIMGVLFLAFIIYIAIVNHLDFAGIKGFCMGLANMWGLLLLVALLGNGLVDLPRTLWRVADNRQYLKRLEFRVANLSNKVRKARESLTRVTQDVHSANAALAPESPLHVYMSRILAKISPAHSAASRAAPRASKRSANLLDELEDVDLEAPGNVGLPPIRTLDSLAPDSAAPTRDPSLPHSEEASDDRAPLAAEGARRSGGPRRTRAGQAPAPPPAGEQRSRARRAWEALKRGWRGRMGPRGVDAEAEEWARWEEDEGPVTRKQLTQLHTRLLAATKVAIKADQEYRLAVESALRLEDIVERRVNPDVRFASLRRVWRGKVGKVIQRALAILLACISITVIFGELVLFLKKPDISPISLLVHAPIYLGVKFVVLLIVVYMCICAYRTLFKLRLFNYYHLVQHQSDASSLLFSAGYLCRLAAPLCYNFLTIVHETEGGMSFSKAMSQMKVVPAAEYFNLYFPLSVIIFVALALFNVYNRLLSCLRIPSFGLDDWRDVEMQKEGRAVLRRERLRTNHAAAGYGEGAGLASPPPTQYSMTATLTSSLPSSESSAPRVRKPPRMAHIFRKLFGRRPPEADGAGAPTPDAPRAETELDQVQPRSTSLPPLTYLDSLTDLPPPSGPDATRGNPVVVRTPRPPPPTRSPALAPAGPATQGPSVHLTRFDR